MNVRLHANAMATPKIRAYFQSSSLSDRSLAEELKLTVTTVRRWRARLFQHDASHTPHRLATTLTPAQEAVVVELRRTLELSLDDLLVVVREFLSPKVSRSGLDRCLRRHDVANLAALRPAAEPRSVKTFKDYAPGFVHVDIKYLPQMADESRRRYLFVAIDRASSFPISANGSHRVRRESIDEELFDVIAGYEAMTRKKVATSPDPVEGVPS